ERVSREYDRVRAGAAPRHTGWRRHAARRHAAAVRLADGRFEPPQPQARAVLHRRGRRRCADRRPSPEGAERHTAGQRDADGSAHAGTGGSRIVRRQHGRVRTLMSMVADLRHAWRAIRQMPIVSTVVVVSLAVGIGITTAVFSWVQAVVLRPLPGVAAAGSLLLVEPRTDTGAYPGVSWSQYRDLRERLHAMSDLIAERMVPLNVGDSGRPHRAYGLLGSRHSLR